MNRANLRIAVTKQADAYQSGRWDATAGGEVDQKIGDVFDQLWRQMLNVNSEYRLGRRTPVSDATGRYLIASLTAGIGDTLERFYRILTVMIDGRQYEGPVPARNWAAYELQGAGGNPLVWYQEGTSLVALPIQALKAADLILVNWIPQRPDRLEADESEVIWPDGREQVLVNWAAAKLLMKGGAETQASVELRGDVQDAHDEMLEDIGRLSTNPRQVQHSDDAGIWAG